MITNKLITPEDYQNEAITKVRNHLLNYIEVDDNDGVNEVLLQSTVASGKTVMGGLIMESVIDHLKRDKNRYHNSNVSFIWVSTSSGGLLEQSRMAVDSYTGKSLNVIDLQTAINRSRLLADDALFLGWEAVNKKDNIVRQDNEIGNLDEILDDTDSKIILIIDESHRDRGGFSNRKVIEDLIKPFAILNLTATPSQANRKGDIVQVDPQRVIDAGRIRRRVKINEDIFESDDGTSYKSKVLRAALKKRQEIIDYADENGVRDYIQQNPLILIQIANDTSSAKDEDKQLDQIMELLLDNGVEMDKVAINLSGRKELFDDIDNNDAEVLIMKQAISTGWDCPRAQILVQFREVQSVTFHLQTLGRIMRTLRGKHYGCDLLDNAYLYTDASDKDFHFDGSIDDEMINATGLTRDSARLKDDFIHDIGIFEIPMQKVVFDKLGEMDSEYIWNALRDEIDLDSLNTDDLDEIYESKGGAQNIKSEDVLRGEDLILHSDKEYLHKLTDDELSDIFDKDVGSYLKNYNIKTMLKFILSGHSQSEKCSNRSVFIHRIFYKNRVELNRVISTVVRQFKENSIEKQLENVPYVIQEEIFRVGLKESATLKYAYDREDHPDGKSSSEEPFINALRYRDEVQYWFMNQMSSEDFSIVYLDKDLRPHQYYPDFFIIDENDRLFIIDVKSKHGDKEFEYTKEKYEAGKCFEDRLNNADTPFEDIIFSMVRLDNDGQPTILKGSKYQEEFTKDWVDFIQVLKKEINMVDEE